MNTFENKYSRAKKRVGELKDFHRHLFAYLIVNTLLLLFSHKISFILLSKEVLGDPEFLNWINWNIWGTPIIWGFALLIHALVIFLKSPFKNWEERQIQKILNQEEEETKKYQ